jgi:transcriptional regulator with XRE-family HTH domain
LPPKKRIEQFKSINTGGGYNLDIQINIKTNKFMGDLVNKNLGEVVRHNIRELRILHNLSTRDMTNLMDISIGSYYKIEAGNIELTYSRLQQIADIYKINLSELFTLGKTTANPLAIVKNKICEREDYMILLRSTIIGLYAELRKSDQK